ncbi:HNH endonuclease [Vibrio cholerae]|uniref:HNH endonuclease n=1 Tax=Vibrio cholerae TaxID=666 RepID=UPI0021D1BF1A|nr:HNH endonuclease [Vibrio cholerae]MCU4221989.1 HNH endonuclease [Vibrio cholerae]
MMIKLIRPDCPHPAALDNGNYKHHLNKEALKKANFDKCMYCESKISHIDFAHVEHFKPKAKDKYPELEFEWTNLGYACPKCNNNKSDKFHEDFPYIDPYSEEPSEYFLAHGTWLFVKQGSERADLTIRDIELNRPELLEKRLEKVTEIQNAITACFRTRSKALRDKALQELTREAESDKEYSFFVKALIAAHAT